MMSNTIIGVFDDRTEAQRAEQELIAAGIDRNAVHLRAREGSAAAASARDDDRGFWETIKDALGFTDDKERSYYREAARRGGVILSATVPEERIDTACTILERHHPVDIEQRAQEWQRQGWTPAAVATSVSTPSARRDMPVEQTRRQDVTGKEKIPVVEEQLRVGKRQVRLGGVRVYSHVTERPVQENVQLREEHVSVQRHPVDRPVRPGDDAFKERAIEASETAEEAVVQKQARVVEEVEVNKDVRQRTETVRDKVRRTDVEVEKLDETDARFRPAYEFADQIAADQRYRGRSWEQIEPDVRRTYEQRYPGSTWEQMKDAVRRGWDRARAKTR
jgi:stress response protein YsnF